MSNAVSRDVLGDILKLIEATLKIPADQVDIDANLESFGINSLIVMELMEEIEKAFDVTLTPAMFSNIDTVRGLVGLVEGLVDVSPAPAAAAQPAAQATSAPGTRNAPAEAVPQSVREFVRGRYAIELAGRDFQSVEEMVDMLVVEHGEHLLRHYGIAEGPGRGAKAPVVAIVGMSCRLPDAADPDAFWHNLLAQKCSIREVPATRWDWQAHYAESVAPGKTVSKWGALIDDVDCFDAAFFGISSDEAKSIDPQLRLLLEETYRAVEDAGISMKKLAGSRTGVFVGYEYAEYEQRLRLLGNQDFTKGPLFSSSSPSYYLANRISHSFDLCGPSEVFNVNCASSAVALNRAFYSLLNGESDQAIVGAASLNLFEDDYIAASQYGVLSPDGTCAVFDDAANGFTRGEGVAAVVLKRLDDARRDNNQIYGLIRASHQNYRGAARNISEVKHESITKVLEQCYEKASVSLESICYVEVDGYASKWADSFEYEGVKAAFQRSQADGKHVALGSVKGNIGNVESVSGIANIMKLALSMRHKVFPATISVNKVNTFLDVEKTTHPLYLATQDIPFDTIRSSDESPVRAGLNSFADSGVNVHIVVEEYMPAREALLAAAPGRQLFVLSAANAARLEAYVQRYIEFLSDRAGDMSFADLAYTAQVGRDPMNERLAVVAGSAEELLEKLRVVKKGGIRERLGLESREIFHGRINPADKSPLISLITGDMAHMQLMQSMQTGQWKHVAQLWVNGVSVPWEQIWQGRGVQRVSLPTYPFARERHWIDVVKTEAPAGERIDVPHEPPVTVDEAQEAAVQGQAFPQWYFYVPSPSAPVPDDEAPLGRAEKMALFLQQEVALQQGKALDEIALDKDFIELGMNSIGVAELIIKTDRLLRTNLSPAVLFKHPEIGTLSVHLAETHAEVIDLLRVTTRQPDPADIEAGGAPEEPVQARPAAPEDMVVPLQVKGDALPLFAMPGAGGNALSLQQLSHALGPSQPFFCIEPVGLDGSTPPMADVKAVAAFNVAAIKSVQSEGPYRLLGYSNGGIVAFEMARQLLAGGDKVASLTLLDTLAPSLLGREAIEKMTVEVFRHFVSSLGAASSLDVGQLQAVPPEQRSAYLYEHVTALGIDLPKRQFMATFDVATASEAACRAYAPEPLPEKLELKLVRATEGFADVPADYGWEALAHGEVQAFDIAANHFTLLDKGPIAEVARLLAQGPDKGPRKPRRDKAKAAV